MENSIEVPQEINSRVSTQRKGNHCLEEMHSPQYYSRWPGCGKSLHLLMDEWINKTCGIYTRTQWNVIQPLKKEGILPFVTTWMNVEGIMLSKISQTEEDKYRMVSLICGIWKTTKNLEVRETVERWLPGTGFGGGKEWEKVGKRIQTFSYKMTKIFFSFGWAMGVEGSYSLNWRLNLGRGSESAEP